MNLGELRKGRPMLIKLAEMVEGVTPVVPGAAMLRAEIVIIYGTTDKDLMRSTSIGGCCDVDR